MKKTALILSMVLLALPMAAEEERVASPDGRLVVTVSDEGGKPTYSVTYDGVPMLWRSPLGVKTDIGDFTQNLRFSGSLKEGPIIDDYSVPTIKASKVHYEANRAVFSFLQGDKEVLDIIFQVSANDIAFRYQIHPLKRDTKVCVIEEASLILIGTTITWKGAISTGQMIPSLSLFCSTAAAIVRPTPIP